MRTLVTIAVAAVILSAPRLTRADDDEPELPSDGAIGVMLVSELLIPDIRIQLREDERLVLSWPVHLGYLRRSISSDLTPFVEPQYQPSTSDLRGVVGARFAYKRGPVGGLVEGGAMLGHDAGTGAVVGLGVIVFGERPMPGVAIVGRATFLPDNERRYDLSLDVTVLTLETLIRIALH